MEFNDPNSTFSTASINETFDNLTYWYTDEDYDYITYVKIAQICISFLLVCCLLAMCVNCLVILSVFWIRTPLTPNLKISLSLAVADALSSSMTGFLLLIDKLGLRTFFTCVAELLRLSGIVITVLHLLALSFNHYIGIMKPLHYNVIVTKRKVTIVIATLWVCPVLVLIALSTLENSEKLINGIHYNTCNFQIFSTFAFRLSYSFFYFFPIILMVSCYTHILITVRKQQNKWKNVSRSGSSKSKGRTVQANNPSQKVIREQARLQGNIKAVYTTLFILGSCFIGWMPALLFYILSCDDCPISGKTLEKVNRDYKYEVMIVRLIENTLIIMKMFANPIIYTIRMKEIKDSTNRMYLAITGIFCPSRRNNNTYGLAYQPSRKQHSAIISQTRINSFRTSTETQVI
ncbi:octopamine receptor beta-2R-like [Diorhabda sublineata]|uniref:octopamine receptor beta-2R-like n=1 Tax=Diorhabda sublineata TaxID=1163346 RepID=UPI0024E1349C|nr:octopamine receptor beta-2R-like [Diorhabda sublineata]XP_056636027.1 octopamine receptor beta-2R-like [Diorhabda sublineata]